MQVIEGGDNALVIMETVLRFPYGKGGITEMSRRATYVFRQENDGRWLCTIDNSYGTSLLDTGTHHGNHAFKGRYRPHASALNAQ
jgi:ketosteroid isomerase-like protein